MLTDRDIPKPLGITASITAIPSHTGNATTPRHSSAAALIQNGLGLADINRANFKITTWLGRFCFWA
ncbi:MAG: hypothetical protein ACTMHW_11785, partial [Hafnia alvei]